MWASPRRVLQNFIDAFRFVCWLVFCFVLKRKRRTCSISFLVPSVCIKLQQKAFLYLVPSSMVTIRMLEFFTCLKVSIIKFPSHSLKLPGNLKNLLYFHVLKGYNDVPWSKSKPVWPKSFIECKKALMFPHLREGYNQKRMNSPYYLHLTITFILVLTFYAPPQQLMAP